MDPVEMARRAETTPNTDSAAEADTGRPTR